MKSAHILNALISGEAVTVDRKYRDPIDIIPRVKIVWSMNELPRVREAGNGLFRRVKVISFPGMADKDRDRKVKETIKLEGAGILNWALTGLRRLQARGQFAIPAEVQNDTEEFRDAVHRLPKLVSS
jgi:putative DNA primase/helicase